MYEVINSGADSGKVRAYYPKASRPITMLAVAMDHGRLCDVARLAYSAGDHDVAIAAIELAPELYDIVDTRKAISGAAGVAPTQLRARDGGGM